MSRMGTAGRRASTRTAPRQDPSQRHALFECGAARALDRGAVRHRIGERHTDFDDVRRVGRVTRNWSRKPRASRESCRHVRDERRTDLSFFGVADRSADGIACGHHSASLSNVRCRVGMSLSPRPDRPIRMHLPEFAFAWRRAPASACADSIAGKIPSAAQHSASACQCVVVIDGLVRHAADAHQQVRAPAQPPDSPGPPTRSAFPESGRSHPATTANSFPAARRVLPYVSGAAFSPRPTALAARFNPQHLHAGGRRGTDETSRSRSSRRRRKPPRDQATCRSPRWICSRASRPITDCSSRTI